MFFFKLETLCSKRAGTVEDKDKEWLEKKSNRYESHCDQPHGAGVLSLVKRRVKMMRVSPFVYGDPFSAYW